MNHTGLLGVLLRLAFFVACTVLLQSAVSGQVAPEPRILSGTVYYAGGNEPAQNVTVELRTTGGNLIAPMATSSTGWFEFRGLQRGVYEIAINADGFEPVNFSVDLFFISSRGNVIYLRPKPSNSAKPPQAHSISAHELSMPQKARDLMESGKKKLYTDKNMQGGLADFQGALLAAPGYYEAHYQIAMAYLLLLLRDDAEKSFLKAIEVSGDSYGDADIGLGTTMLDKRDFAGGEKLIRRGIELSPASWLGYYELGRALLNENRIDDAEKAALQARSFAPHKAIVYRLLSSVHLQKKNYQALLEDLDAYLKLDSDSPAGVRAKQLREQVQQKIAADKYKPAVDSKP
jgi:Flp pilus assembly protein TadD